MSHPEAEEEGSETPAVGRKAGVESMMMSLTEKEPTTEGVIRLRTHRVGDVQR